MAKSKGKNSDYKAASQYSVSKTDDKNGKKKTTSTMDRAQKIANDRKKKKSQPNKPREKGKIKEYFKGVKLEMKKVVWPTKKELGSFTVVVLCTCAAFALLFWGLDSGTLAAIKAICF